MCVCMSGPTHVCACMHTPAGMNAACLSEAPILRSEHCVVVKPASWQPEQPSWAQRGFMRRSVGPMGFYTD